MSIVSDVLASLEKDAVIQTKGEPDGRPYLEGDTMTDVTGYDGSTFTVGDRVEIHPGTDLWMMGRIGCASRWTRCEACAPAQPIGSALFKLSVT